VKLLDVPERTHVKTFVPHYFKCCRSWILTKVVSAPSVAGLNAGFVVLTLRLSGVNPVFP
jgi:hypothetical protein